MGEEFNADYYSALAQVVPVLLIAVVYLSYFKRRDDDDWSISPGLASFLIGTVLGSLVSEQILLETLRSREEMVGVEVMVVGLTFGGLVFLLGAEFIAPPLKALWQEVPKRHRPTIEIIGTIAVIVGFVAVVGFRFDPYYALAVAVVCFFIGPTFLTAAVDVARGVSKLSSWLRRRS